MEMKDLRAFSSLMRSIEAQSNDLTDLSEYLKGDLWDSSEDTDESLGEKINFPTYLAQILDAHTVEMAEKLDKIIELLEKIVENTANNSSNSTSDLPLYSQY